MYTNLTRADSSISMSKCWRCGKTSITHDLSSGEVYCNYCGTIIEQKTSDIKHDFKIYDYENDVRHTGTPTALAIHDYGLSTIIGKTNKDVKGNKFSLEISNTIRRMRIQDQRSHLQKNVNMNFRIAFDMLQRIQDKIGVSDNTREIAAYIYRKAVERKITQGRSIQAVIAASMYVACRNTQTLRTLKDISEAVDIKRKTISQSYRAIVKQLDIKIPVVDQTHCVLKISNNLELPSKIKHLALKIIEKAENLGMLAGKDPIGSAAAAIYYACILKQELFTQNQIADASGITVVTIRNRFYDIQKMIDASDIM